jgi:hypothetical protein
MGRTIEHDSNNTRVKAHRNKKVKNPEQKVYCDVCNEYIYYQSNARVALRKHRGSSKKHKALLKLKDATKGYDEDSAEESEDEIDNSTVVDSETWIPESDSNAIFKWHSKGSTFIAFGMFNARDSFPLASENKGVLLSGMTLPFISSTYGRSGTFSIYKDFLNTVTTRRVTLLRSQSSYITHM